MKPTRVSGLLLPFLLAGAAGYLLTKSFYDDVPSPPVIAPVFLLLLAAVEGYLAWTTAGRLRGRRGMRPADPLAVARIAALAKATSPVGAVFAGGYAGFLGYVARIDSTQAATDVRTAALGIGAAVVLVVVALVMENVCRVRPPS